MMYFNETTSISHTSRKEVSLEDPVACFYKLAQKIKTLRGGYRQCIFSWVFRGYAYFPRPR